MSASKNCGTFIQWNTMQQKERTPSFCDIMSGTGEHYVKWNRPSSERQIPYDLTYKKKSNEQNKLTNKTEAQEWKHGTDWQWPEGCRKGWIRVERRGRDWSKYMYEWLMDMDNSVGTDYGSGGWEGERRAKGEKLGQL